ncbi:MAG TPA: lysophospholipid acyltransferase family protein [Candidatus Acidoferrales bacterium]|jgi:Kdo2-lipid IVA lauroyltransferase/acyltransferase|nr:lysophospholipid acyltransferase family protein [Candidatus Acidoferrales bacterium]
MREWFEYVSAWAGVKSLGLLPRPVARFVGASFAAVAYAVRTPLRRAAMFNLGLAFPDWSDAKRKRVIRGMIQQIGWMAAEFSQFPKYTRKNIQKIVVLDGFENFDAARRRGKGVLFLTGHMSAWELAPFAHALYGHPLHFLVRPIANRRVDELINHYRCLSGNQPIEKNKSARSILRILADGGTVGILSDHNTVLEESVFVDFFGIPASTTSGLARIALRTGAAVVPGFLSWDSARRKYRLRFEPAIELAQTGDEESDVRENTARFTKTIEDYVRAYPEQWLWVHKRWKTRPPGEKAIYPA